MIDLFGGFPPNTTAETAAVQFLDTTLRDGEQAPGVALSPEEKVTIARELDAAGVPIIEAGSACTGEQERAGISRVVNESLNAKITSFARGLRADVDHAVECGVDGITLVVPASDRHIEGKVGTTHDDVIQSSVALVDYAKDHGLWVELLGEDGSRSDLNFLEELLRAGVEAGADRVCWADTVGHASPDAAYEAVSRLAAIGPTSTHTHDDLGLAVTNVLASIAAGADTVHATVNGIGERAGNAALEEVAVALWHCYGIEPLNLERLYPLAERVAETTGVGLAPNKAVVGENAFTHESGIHTDGMLKDDAMYEPYAPASVGRDRRLVLGKHAGRAGVQAALAEHGIEVEAGTLAGIVDRVKELAERDKRVTDADLLAIADDVQGADRERRVELEELSVLSGGETPTASVRLRVDGEECVAAGVGTGPVDAVANAVRAALDDTVFRLESYHVDAVTGGTDAVVTVEVEVARGDRSICVAASDVDITCASGRALVDGIDRLLEPPVTVAPADD